MLLNIPLNTTKIKEIIFELNEIEKNDKEKFKEIYSIISNYHKEIEDLKKIIENKNKEIGELKNKINDINQNKNKEIAELKSNINKIKENNRKEFEELKQIINENKENIKALIKNEIICEYNIKNINKKEDTQILNCYENAKRDYSDWEDWKKIKGIENETEIKDNCKLYLNDQKINFRFKYHFKEKGKNSIKILLKKPLTNLNLMFYLCSSLTSLKFI